jgi:ketosteroid isomerase-like protein
VGEAKEVVERFYERFGAGDLPAAFACFDHSCVAVGLSGPMDNEQHEAAARKLKAALPDCRMELIRAIEAGDEIYVTGRFTGTHEADLETPIGTLVATGKRLDLLFVDYFRVVGGKIVECEVVRDRLGMLLQLGWTQA